MMNTRCVEFAFRLTACAVLLCVAASCTDSMVEGEVFIRTRGGETIPLSLVRVDVRDFERTEEAIKRVRESTSGTPTESDFFRAFPPPIASVTTDASGRFRVRIPRNGAFAITAHDKRIIGDETEHYYWCVGFGSVLSPRSDRITLANQNIVGSGNYFESMLQ